MRTRSGCASASSWATMPPIEMPSTWAESSSSAASSPAASSASWAIVIGPSRRAAGADAAVVVDDHLEVLAQRRQERLAPVQGGAAHAHDQQQRRPRSAALVVELDLPRADDRHGGILHGQRELILRSLRSRAAGGRARGGGRHRGPPRPARSALRPATRTPSSRTGRAGAYSRRSRSACALTSSGSRVGAASGVRAGDGGEVVEAHLDPDRAAAAPVGGEARAQLAGHAREHGRAARRGR